LLKLFPEEESEIIPVYQQIKKEQEEAEKME